MKIGFKFKSITSKKFRELLHDFNGQMDFDLSKRFLGDIYVLSDGRVIQEERIPPVNYSMLPFCFLAWTASSVIL
jgi:hypothetical protein